MQEKTLIFDVPIGLHKIVQSKKRLTYPAKTSIMPVLDLSNRQRYRQAYLSYLLADESRKYTEYRPMLLLASSESAACSLKRKPLKKVTDMNQQNLPQFADGQALVTIKHNQPITTSRQIAITFGKEHRAVLHAIHNLRESTPTNFNQRNFASADYRDTQGKRQPMYELTRDGFTLLAMGFTGKRALEFKLAYINAFNEMERKLAEPKTITVKSHTRRIARKPTQKALPAPATDNVRGDFLYEKMKLMVVASEFFDKATDVTDRAQRLSTAIDCMSSAYRITNQIKGVR